MTSPRHAKLAVKALVGVGVLLASGAATATTAQAGSPVSSEMHRLQATWGTDVVRTAQAFPESRLILVGTHDQALLGSSNPQRWLGSRYPVVLMFVHPSGAPITRQRDKCGFGAHLMSEGTGM